MKGIDAAFSLSPHAANLKSQGIGFAARYYSRNPAKDLSPPEAQALTKAGLLIVSVWETRGDLYASFNAPKGQSDATAALALADACGQPKGTPIYFAVDFDATADQIAYGIIPYFQAISAKLHGSYLVGVYGSGMVCDRLHARGLVSYLWLAQSRGWQGTSGFPGAHIRQGSVSGDVLDGYDVDTDESASDDFGGWQIGGADRPAVDNSPPPSLPAEKDVAATIAALQRQLAALGYYRGKIDGIAGPQTMAALMKYEQA